MRNDPFTGKVIGCAIEIHRVLRAGLLESTYQQSLAHELHLKGIAFQLEQLLPVEYKKIKLDCGYRIDILVEYRLIIEPREPENTNLPLRILSSDHLRPNLNRKILDVALLRLRVLLNRPSQI